MATSSDLLHQQLKERLTADVNRLISQLIASDSSAHDKLAGEVRATQRCINHIDEIVRKWNLQDMEDAA